MGPKYTYQRNLLSSKEIEREKLQVASLRPKYTYQRNLLSSKEIEREKLQVASFPLLLPFDELCLEMLLPPALQILCTIYGNLLAEMPKSLSICFLVFSLISNNCTTYCLNSRI
jgi:hypothetical protein